MRDDKAVLLIRFGASVRVRRYQLGWTQLVLAERVGCSLQAIGDIERGVANPSLWMVFRICQALDVCGKDLISF